MKQTMKQFELHPMRLLAGACGLFTLLAMAPMSVAQQAAAVATKTVASPTAKTALAAQPAAKAVAEKESAVPNSANQQGIKVHGHWVLQVKNADGTLGERREFDNSLVTSTATSNLSGDQLLGLLLSGNGAPGDPAIALVPSVPAGAKDASDYCIAGSILPNENNNCYVLVTAQSGLGNYFFNASNGLTTTLTITPPLSWVLAGNYTIPSLTTITFVQTLLPICVSTSSAAAGIQENNLNNLQGSATTRSADLSASACTKFTGQSSGTTLSSGSINDAVVIGTFTSTAVGGGPMTVTAGQIVQVTVTITFS
jgi:hypothetical protein